MRTVSGTPGTVRKSRATQCGESRVFTGSCGPYGATGFYIAIIAVLLIYVRTGRPVSKYAYAMLSLVSAGQATMEDILPILERRTRECELDRQRQARKKAEKTAP